MLLLLVLPVGGIGGGLLSSCTDNASFLDDSGIEFESGEKIVFTTNVPNINNVTTRAYTPDAELLKGYSTISDDYTLSIKMYEESSAPELGTCTYKPVVNEETKAYSADGRLKAEPADGEKEFLWNSNVKKYAFEATAGTEVLEVDQSTQEKWFAQDRLHGYAFAPLLNDGTAVDNVKALNYHTNKEWGALNKAWREADSNNEMHSAEDYKQIPLFLQHERSWITLILKAGNGVSRDALKFENAKKNVSVNFFNYVNGQEDPTVMDKPYLTKTTVNYEKDKNGDAQTGAETTAFNVIVDPHNYSGDNANTDKIAAISIAGLKFSFFASNDDNYTANTESASDEQKLAMAAYNLEAGKHLTITATLTTDRIVYITAWIEDWTEVATSTICDDYGNNGDPILINSREDLINFLSGDDNQSGNVAIVVANSLDLDKNITTTYYKEGDEIPSGKKVGDVKETTTSDDSWSNHSQYTLNATLNMAGAKFYTSSQLLKTIESTGSIINGTIVMNNTLPIPSAIAATNKGTLERINVMPNISVSPKASKAGLVELNNGTIYQCNSTLPVYGTEENAFVGGIAAKSMSLDGTIMPVIDGCTVNAPVKGSSEVPAIKGGGIVGLAEGRVTNNTFEYGITLLQPSDRFKNIIGAKAENELRAENNWWPTKTKNELDSDKGKNGNANIQAKYDNVLDCQEELMEMLKSNYNTKNKAYRVAADFTVNSDYWKRTDGSFVGQKHDDVSTQDDYCNGNIYCELDGNNKMITLAGTATVQIPTKEEGGKATEYESKTTSAMLFSNITGQVHDLVINISVPLIATPSVNNETDKVLSAVDAIAPLAYSVRGADAKISNIKVKMDEGVFVQAALPAGVVCWANEGATIEDCQVKGQILSWLPNAAITESSSGESDARRYAGGIVACAAKATIKRCTFLSASNTLKEAKSSGTTVYYGGILGATVIKDINGSRENPEVSLIDCVSWFSPEATEQNKGAIVGRAQYTDTDNKNYNGTVTSGENKCQGNWWNTTYKGVADRLAGETEESVIGKCSGATPTIDSNY